MGSKKINFSEGTWNQGSGELAEASERREIGPCSFCCLFVAGETKRAGEMVSRLEGGGLEVGGILRYGTNNTRRRRFLPHHAFPHSSLHSSLMWQPSIPPFNTGIFHSGYDGSVDAIGCEGTRYFENASSDTGITMPFPR